MRTILLLALALMMAGCSTTDDTPTTSTPVASTPASTTPVATTPVTTPTPTDDLTVEIEDFAFVPSTLSVPVGATVTWSNKDGASHTVTADAGAFGSSALAKDGEFTHTFAANATLAYHCEIHPNMKGTIVVGSGVAPTPTPTTTTPVTTTPTSTTPPAPITRDVAISNFAFVDAAVSVPVGSTVRWTNADSSGHTVTADDGSFNSGRLGEGAEFSQTFATAGSYAYKCAFHPSMQGTVTVTA